MQLAHRLLLFFLIFQSNVFGQTAQYRGALTLATGTAQYAGDINIDWYQFRNPSAFTAMSYAHYLNPRLDIRGGVAFGSWSYDSDVNNSFYADFFQAAIDLKVKLLKYDGYKCLPYLFAGMGLHDTGNWTLYNQRKELIHVDQQDALILHDDLNKARGMMNVGLGFQYAIADRLFLVAEERIVYTGEDGYDGIRENAPDYMMRHTVGFSFGLAAYVDMDHDGVEDKRDQCPMTPSIAQVNEHGCPIDSDGDLIPDFEDACPHQAGMVNAHGCPDQDRDGIRDAEDLCPDTAGEQAFDGCPDSDGDGIQDKNDKCPDVAGSRDFDGCADDDQDGVSDPNDQCPGTASGIRVDERGCPLDFDHDGIPDHEDKCPGTPGVIAEQGCPEIKQEVIALFKKALNGIRFETGKDVITKDSWPILDSVVVVMKENTAYKLNIAGHTDNQGDPLKNQILSEQRAKAVMNYLVEHGVEAVRIVSAIGYGDQKPVADNTTKEGRKLNRRVEFEIEY